MIQAEFKITYKGPALANGTMDVRDLAPSLMGLGYLFTDANTVLNEDRSLVQVNVKSGFEHGSFKIDFQLVEKVAAEARDFFAGDSASAAANLAELLGFAKGSIGITVLGLIRLLRGRRPEKITQIPNTNASRVEAPGPDGVVTHVVNNGVINLYFDAVVRKSVQRLASPLHSSGVNEIEISDDDEIIETIDRDEVEFFDFDDHEDLGPPNTEGTYTALLRVVSPYLESRKWRLSDGAATEWYAIDDDQFWQRVKRRREKFSHGDQLRAVVRMRQWMRPGNVIRIEKAVVHVEHHVSLPPDPETEPMF